MPGCWPHEFVNVANSIQYEIHFRPKFCEVPQHAYMFVLAKGNKFMNLNLSTHE